MAGECSPARKAVASGYGTKPDRSAFGGHGGKSRDIEVVVGLGRSIDEKAAAGEIDDSFKAFLKGAYSLLHADGWC